MMTDQELLNRAYHAFNSRDLDAALTLMHPEVEWPNTMQGGYVRGHEGIRAYWSIQWSLVDPRVTPVGFEMDSEGRIVVDVHQVVNDLQSRLLEDVKVRHIFSIEDGLIRRMDMGEDRIMATNRAE